MVNMEPSLLDLCWRLSDKKEAVRLEAAHKILVQLGGAGRKAAKDEDAPAAADDMVGYILQRLIRGLASERDTSRKGYFICLVELLRQKRDISMEQVVQIMEKNLNIKGSKSEEGAHVCGKILCYGALLRSGKVNSERAELKVVVERLLSLSKKRSYAAVLANQFIVDLVRNAQTFKKDLWPILKDSYKWSGEGVTLEAIWLLTEIHDKFSSVLNKSFLSETFGSNKLLDQGFAKEVASVLQSGNVTIQAIRNGSVLERIVGCFDKEPGFLLKFWTDHISPTITKSSCHKTSVAFILLNVILNRLSDSSQVPGFLTDNLLGSILFLASRMDSKTDDNALVLSTLEKIVSVAKATPEIQKPVLKALLTSPGNIAFDKVTGSNSVQKLLAFVDVGTVKYVAELFHKAVVGTTGSDSNRHIFTSQERVYATHQLAKLVSHPSTQAETKWKEQTLNFILATTLFELKKAHGSIKAAPLAFSREAKTLVKDSFFRALDFKVKSFEIMCEVLGKVLDFACELMTDNSVAVLRNLLSKKSEHEWKRVVQVVNQIRELKVVGKEDRVFQLLFTHLGFQMLTGGEEVVEILQDLHSCYAKSKQAMTKAVKSAKLTKQAEDESEPVWVEVVVDLLLSLLSQNKSILRQVVSSVTALLCPHMTSNALQAVIDVIDEEKVDDEDGEGEEEDDDEDDEEMKSDGSGREDDEEDESEEESEDEVGKDDVSTELKSKIKEAMGERLALDSDAESIDMDDMDEEDMKLMDEALGKAFRMMSGKKSRKEEKKDKEDLIARMHFKVRALDIIDVYLNHQPPMSHVLYLVMPLINAIHAASKVKDFQPLQARLKSTLKKLTNIKKADVDKELDIESVPNLLQSLVNISNSGTPLMAQLTQPHPLFAQSCTLVLKCSQQLNDAKLDSKILEIYDKAMDDFFNKRHCQLPLAFFLKPLQGNWSEGWKLADKLIKNGFSPEMRQFRKTQAITLLAALLKSPSSHNGSPDKIVKSAVGSLCDLLTQHLKEFADGTEMKPRYLCELLHLVQALHSVGAHEHIPKWEDLREALASMPDRIPKNRHFHDVKKAYNKACVPLKVQVVPSSQKRKRLPSEPTSNGFFGDLLKECEKPTKASKKADSETPAVDEVQEQQQKKKKKKKKSKEAAQKRKEKRLFEIEGQFEGMEMPSFSNLYLDGNLNFADTPPHKQENKVKVKDSKKGSKKTAKSKLNGDASNVQLDENLSFTDKRQELENGGNVKKSGKPKIKDARTAKVKLNGNVSSVKQKKKAS